MSTPNSLELPPGTRRADVETARGTFAVLEAVPAAEVAQLAPGGTTPPSPPGGVAELGTALLVPGYTGSKEDFIAVLGRLAAAGRRVLAVDMRGQYQTPGPDDATAYHPAQLGADIAALAAATGAAHLLGHSFGGLVVREAALHGAHQPSSLTLMCSGPGALPGPRAEELRFMLSFLAGVAPRDLAAKIAEIWREVLEPQAIADGVPAPVLAFLRGRMLANSPAGLAAMARHLLTATDKTAELAGLGVPTLVLYGADDNAWPPSQQAAMAERLGVAPVPIQGAAHSPALEAPASTARALTVFWNAAEGAPVTPGPSQLR